MKKIKRALSLVLVFCMLCTMTVTGFAADTTSGGQTDFMKVVHLDAGRKYFSVDSIKKIIDNASADGYNYLELGVGGNTPVIIKYPFWKMTYQNAKAFYVCVNLSESCCPKEIQKRSICLNRDIGTALHELYLQM